MSDAVNHVPILLDRMSLHGPNINRIKSFE